ncbi:unnamed protein product [Phaedon cochleariae]|uniref:DUF7869 domain-containing protein n=1 Tax=Phaedon cochleariae TaxID=80249 RepID=A0A9N9S8W8_PHACE|nr:unnamed protein product [Phaedon cochleariae]
MSYRADKIFEALEEQNRKLHEHVEEQAKTTPANRYDKSFDAEVVLLGPDQRNNNPDLNQENESNTEQPVRDDILDGSDQLNDMQHMTEFSSETISKPGVSKLSLQDDSTESNEVGTKLSFRKIIVSSYNENSGSSEEDPFSSGSSDNYEPSSESDSDSETVESPDTPVPAEEPKSTFSRVLMPAEEPKIADPPVPVEEPENTSSRVLMPPVEPRIVDPAVPAEELERTNPQVSMPAKEPKIADPPVHVPAEEPEFPVKGKKRVKRVETWAKEKAKRQKNSGKEYQSKSGNIVQAKSMKPPCPVRCVLKCADKFSEDFRRKLFEDFWELACLQQQRDFLGACVEQLELSYRRISAANPRKPNCAFYLRNNDEKMRVCKTFLLNTLGVSERTLRTVISSKLNGSGMIVTDKRGKHSNHKKTSDEILNSIRNHIDSIPRIESHYVRSDTSRQYIDGGLCIAELHRNYSEERTYCNREVASYDTYAKVFNTEYNIGFFSPKKDQCDLCESYKNASNDERIKLEEKYNKHSEEKDLSRKVKTEDKEKAKEHGVILAVYDLQAVLPVPMGQTSAFFYKSRLNCYNFTITNIGNDQTKSFFWHEGLGHRGAIEIGTCVLNYLQEISENTPGMDVIFYSDNCGGQKKNRFLIGAYLYAVGRFNIKSITHKYLIRGHTQNEGDAIHSVIERALKRTKKSGPIYVPDQYITVIQNARKKGNPVEVKEMGYADFVDIKSLYDDMGINISRDIDGNDFKINDIRIMQFERGADVFRFKTSYKQEEWSFVSFRPRRRRSELKDIETVTLKHAYSENIKISENKRKDLKSLIEANIIPKFYRYFYDTVTN